MRPPLLGTAPTTATTTTEQDPSSEPEPQQVLFRAPSIEAVKTVSLAERLETSLNAAKLAGLVVEIDDEDEDEDAGAATVVQVSQSSSTPPLFTLPVGEDDDDVTVLQVKKLPFVAAPATAFATAETAAAETALAATASNSGKPTCIALLRSTLLVCGRSGKVMVVNRKSV